jgi:hypothetical protein
VLAKERAALEIENKREKRIGLSGRPELKNDNMIGWGEIVIQEKINQGNFGKVSKNSFLETLL